MITGFFLPILSANHPPGKVVIVRVIAKEAVRNPSWVPVAPKFLAYIGRRGMTSPKPSMLTKTAKHSGNSWEYFSRSVRSFLNVLSTLYTNCLYGFVEDGCLVYCERKAFRLRERLSEREGVYVVWFL